MDGKMHPVARDAHEGEGNRRFSELRSERRTIPGPRLSWPSRRWELGATSAPPPALRVTERFGSPSGNRLISGDSLDVARSLLAQGWGGRVDLVYVDPPFASQATYVQETRLDGPADRRVARTRAYEDSWPTRKATLGGETEDGVGTYLDMLAPRLEAMAALLAPTGTLWVHLDWRASYLVRVLLDEILGRSRFVNEIVWRRAPNLGRQAASGQFGRTLDTIVVYGGPDARLNPPTRLEPVPSSGVRRDEHGRPFTTAPRGDYTDASMTRLAAEGRVHETASGRKYVKYFLEANEAGELCRERRIDTLWTDVRPLRHAAVSERTGFPTQKPRALLERIIRCATPATGTVVDLFAGSGTTGDAAHALGRTFLLGDRGPVAINTARARLLRAGASFDVEVCGDVMTPPGPVPEIVLQARGAGEVGVRLIEPKEPLGWAVGAAGNGAPSFVAAWHSERRPGAVPTPASLEAAVAWDGRSPIDVRVYADTGSVSSWTGELA